MRLQVGDFHAARGGTRFGDKRTPGQLGGQHNVWTAGVELVPEWRGAALSRVYAMCLKRITFAIETQRVLDDKSFRLVHLACPHDGAWPVGGVTQDIENVSCRGA